MEKRGQITIFIIIGLIILISIILVLYLKDIYNIIKSQENTQVGIESSYTSLDVENYVQECIEKTAIEAVLSLGLHGGTLTQGEKSLDTGLSFVNYGYFVGENTLPSVQKMENELSLYMNELLDFCLDEFSPFPENININSQETKTKVEIKDNIFFEVNKIIEITEDETKITFKEFDFEVPVRLKHLYELSNIIVEEEINDKGWLPYNIMVNFDVVIYICICTSRLC